MTPSGIETATFRFVAQYLNHCATISGLRFYTTYHLHIEGSRRHTVPLGLFILCRWRQCFFSETSGTSNTIRSTSGTPVGFFGYSDENIRNPSLACGLYPPSYLIPLDYLTLRVSEMKVRSPSPIVVQISWVSLRACTCCRQIKQMYASLANTIFPTGAPGSYRHVWNCVGFELGLRWHSSPFIFALVSS
jgi:hypothetical protein